MLPRLVTRWRKYLSIRQLRKRYTLATQTVVKDSHLRCFFVAKLYVPGVRLCIWLVVRILCCAFWFILSEKILLRDSDTPNTPCGLNSGLKAAVRPHQHLSEMLALLKCV